MWPSLSQVPIGHVQIVYQDISKSDYLAGGGGFRFWVNTAPEAFSEIFVGDDILWFTQIRGSRYAVIVIVIITITSPPPQLAVLPLCVNQTLVQLP